MFTFYKEEKFRDTEIGRVPEDWKVIRFRDIFKFKRGFSYRSGQITKEPTKIRFITINDIEKEGGFKRNTEKIYVKENVSINLDFFLEKGDLLIANTDMSKGFIIGAPILIDDIDDKFVYSMDLTKLIFDKSRVDSKFMFYYLKQENMRRKMKTFAQGTNVLHLNHNLVKNIRISLPSLLEQKAIAHILSTVDDAIQKTNEIIAKAERLKKGLMQELLTKGIGHKEFKDTELGKLPKEWGVVKIKDIATIRGSKRVNLNETVFFIPMELVPLNDLTCKYEVRHKKAIKSFTYCEPGDLLIAKITPSFENGKQGFVPKNIKAQFVLATTEVFPLKVEHINKFFLFYILKYKKYRKILENSMRGTTGRQRVSKNALLNLKIPSPPLSEQKIISEILMTVDEKIRVERKRKEKLELIKKGLMNDLLTGKIRVHVPKKN